MATKKRPNKSALIRQYLADHPGTGPTELSSLIKADHRVDVPPAMISNLASRAKAKQRRAAMSPTQLDSADMFTAVLLASTLIQRCGSVEAARTALDRAKQLRDTIT